MGFSEKQKEFFQNAHHRWNVMTGATGSGKTYLTYFLIPIRLRELAGKPGLNVFLGNTKGTLQRNVIEPLRELWGPDLVSDIKSDNTAQLFGEKVFCLGADKVNSVNRLRGSTWKYANLDEVATYHPDVFTMAKSRLRAPGAMADATCNPEHPGHWFKKFIDSDADVYHQHYTIDDNPYLDPSFVANLKKEYFGTVYYDRYILGRWTQAEGRVYKTFTQKNILDEVPKGIYRVTLAADFGGNKSATAFCCVGWYADKIVILDEFYSLENKGVEWVKSNWKTFVEAQRAKGYAIDRTFGDSAEQLIIKSINGMGLGYHMENSYKRPVVDRIRLFDVLFSSERAHVMRHCVKTIEAIEQAVYDDKKAEDVRLDDGTTNIDSLDAMEYSVERDASQLVEFIR
jgi:PBSX family phage terminase large subunit